MRPTRDEVYLRIAELIATRSTCSRRSVGCLLADEDGVILALGYSGVPKSFKHCTDSPCEGSAYKSGERIDLCLATHAEINSLIRCKDFNNIDTAYITVTPCNDCIKALLNTSCRRIVARESYPHFKAQAMWASAKREMIILKGTHRLQGLSNDL